MPTLKEGAPTYYLPKFSQKLYENEEILAEGGRASLAPPLDPPLQTLDELWNITTSGGSRISQMGAPTPEGAPTYYLVNFS